MKQYLNILTGTALFAGIEAENIPAMLGCLGAKQLRFGKRESILTEGEAAGRVGILLKGQAQVMRTDYFGVRTIVSGVEVGDLFAESFACAGVEKMPVSVVAVTECEVLLLDCRRILHACGRACDFHQSVIYNLMRIVAEKNLRLHSRMEVLAHRSTREKLLAYLAGEAKKRGSARFEIPFDRQELADYLQVDRSGLSAEIGKLRREGVLFCEKNRFELTEGE